MNTDKELLYKELTGEIMKSLWFNSSKKEKTVNHRTCPDENQDGHSPPPLLQKLYGE